MNGILARVLDQSNQILSQLARPLVQYSYLQNTVLTTEVTTNPGFQRKFNAFYRVRRGAGWRAKFYQLLEREKLNKDLIFEVVLNEIYEVCQMVEPSFSSKLVATIRPEQPVYDALVRRHLSLEVPPAYWPASNRLRALVRTYAQLEESMGRLISDRMFSEVRARFDAEFPHYLWVTDVKKLDLCLWQLR